MKTLTAPFFGWAIVLTLAGAVSVQADTFERNKAWTSVGSAGILTRPDLDKVRFDGPSLTFAAGQTGQVTVRYNVVAVDGLFAGIGDRMGFRLDLNYLDAVQWGSNVSARLLDVDINGAGSHQLLTFNSENYPQVSRFQRQSVSTCMDYNFDFGERAIYLEVTIGRSAGTPGAPNPILRGLQVAPVACVD